MYRMSLLIPGANNPPAASSSILPKRLDIRGGAGAAAGVKLVKVSDEEGPWPADGRDMRGADFLTKPCMPRRS